MVTVTIGKQRIQVTPEAAAIMAVIAVNHQAMVFTAGKVVVNKSGRKHVLVVEQHFEPLTLGQE